MPYPPQPFGYDPPHAERRCERVESPRDDQGMVDSLIGAFGIETLPEEMRQLLARIG